MFTSKYIRFISLVILSAVFTSAKCEFKCDLVVRVDDPTPFFTFAAYEIPTNYTRIDKSVPCPCTTARPCLRKCCLKGDTYTASTQKCNHKTVFQLLPAIIGDNPLIHGSLCSGVERSLKILKILVNGSLELPNRNLPLDKYCIDYFEEKEDFRLLECEPNSESSEKPPLFKLLVIICLAFSIACLLVTLFIYSCNQELRNVPGKVLLCYASSFLTTELCLIGTQFISPSPGMVCVTTAYVLQFSFSATFFWLNVMCLDIWSAFRKHKFRNRGTCRNNKFYLYCLYAWGIPLAISIVIMLIDLSVITGNFVKPEMAQRRCWFKTYKAMFWYFYSYTSILLLLNLYMFATTSLNLLITRKKLGKIWKSDGSKRFNAREKHRFFLYLKLFSIMGITWTIDMLSYYMRDFNNLNYVWLSSDFTNMLQGFFIFLIFVCNRKVSRLLDEKFLRLGINLSFVKKRASMCQFSQRTWRSATSLEEDVSNSPQTRTTDINIRETPTENIEGSMTDSEK